MGTGNILSKIGKVYKKQYKKLLFIPFTLLILAIISISIQTATTGDFINKGITLKGGITITILTDKSVDTRDLESKLISSFPENDASVRSLTSAGRNIGYTIDMDLRLQDKEKFDELISFLESNMGIILNDGDYTLEEIGSSLGASFFRETLVALLIAFLFMGVVVFIYFRSIIPSAAIVFAAFSDILITLAVVNIIGMRISTAGIAAFLMLIGYAVDTNILLSTKVLKRKEGTVHERVIGALKTGIMMTSTTLAAVIVALLFAQAEVIKQIMTILLIGLIVDMINTWIQNVGILKLYLKKKNEHKD